MRNDLENVRMGLWHLHIKRGHRFRIGRNGAHRGYPDGRFAIYELLGVGGF